MQLLHEIDDDDDGKELFSLKRKHAPSTVSNVCINAPSISLYITCFEKNFFYHTSTMIWYTNQK